MIADESIAHLRAIAAVPDLGDSRYRLDREIGHGGMGAVYRARDLTLGRDVAIKVLASIADDPAIVERFRRETAILAQLEHPGIVPVHDAGTLPDGRVFYAMKLVRGSSLSEARPRESLAATIRLFLRVCEAVDFAHARGIVHRDIKPDNIMIGQFGEVLVMDWGIAKVLGDAPQRTVPSSSAHPTTGHTADGAVIGTPGFMAPEQSSGRPEDIDERTDVWALGAVLRTLVQDAGEYDPAGWKQARNPLTAILERAMALSRSDRYDSVASLSADLPRLMDGERVSVYVPTLPETVAAWASRNQAAIMVVAAYLFMRLLLFMTLGR